MRKLLLIGMAFVLAACSAVANATGNKFEIEQNHAKWLDNNISHYRYHLTLSCFCAFNEDMPLIIEVQDGKILSMDFQSGKEIDPSLGAMFEKYATIDRIFSELKAGLNGAADEVAVKYDPIYGFPAEAKIDVEKQATDDELYLTISGFEKIP